MSQARHDLRAPLINIQGFSSELRDAVKQLVTLIARHRGVLPEEFQIPTNRLIEEDLSPCLDLLDRATMELHQRIDSFASLDMED